MPTFSTVPDLWMDMRDNTFGEFLGSSDTLRVYRDDRLLFASGEGRLLPLVEYIDRFAPYERGVTVCDRVVGNAAALLLKKIDCRQVYSSLGSQLAAGTLSRYGIRYHFNETAPHIQNQSGDDMCPMEKLSLGKEPEEFYRVLRECLQEVS